MLEKKIEKKSFKDLHHLEKEKHLLHGRKTFSDLRSLIMVVEHIAKPPSKIPRYFNGVPS